MKKISIMACLLLVGFGTSDGDRTSATNFLTQTSKAFASIAKQTTPSVVSIYVETVDSDFIGFDDNQFGSFTDDFFRRFLGEHFGTRSFRNQNMRSLTSKMRGSGFIVSSDGYILTNKHVIKNADRVTVTLHSKKKYGAVVIGSDAKTDLAVLKIDAKELPFLLFADSDAIEPGEFVMAIGSPFSLDASVSMGIISAKHRNIIGDSHSAVSFLQTDAAINRGNSGGPLISAEGRVVGVNTSITTYLSRYGGFDAGNVGVGFAIPSNTAKKVMEELIRHGIVVRPSLGVVLQDITADLAHGLSIDREGVLITNVHKGSVAEKNGLRSGDVIVRIDDKDTNSIQEATHIIVTKSVGDIAKIDIVRGKATLTMNVKLEEQKDEEVATTLLQKMGFDVCDIDSIAFDSSEQGVVVSKLVPYSLAHRAGIKLKDIIRAVVIDGRTRNVASVDELMGYLSRVSDGESIVFVIGRKNFRKFCAIKL